MNTTDELYYQHCLAANKPYFGQILWALQGNPLRHGVMLRLVEQECRNRERAPLSILEIGSWAGGSATTWAQAIKKYNRGEGVVVCVDAWKTYFDPDRLDQGGFEVYREMADALANDRIYPLFLHNIRAAGHDDIVLPFRGTSDDVLPLLQSETFDLLFVDGDHTAAHVRRDLLAASRLVREGGILCGDDLEIQADQLDTGLLASQQACDYVRDARSGIHYHPGVSLAVGEFFGQVSCWEGFWAMRRHVGGWEPIVLEERSIATDGLPAHVRGIRATDYLECGAWYLDRDRPLESAQLLEGIDVGGLGSADAYAGLAMRVAERLWTAQRADHAVRLLERTRTHVPDSASILHLLGSIRLQRGEVGASLDLLTDAARLQPDNAMILNGLGEALYRSKRIAEAEAAFTRACALAPQCAEAYNNLAVIHWDRGDVEQALAHSLGAVHRAPDDGNTVHNFIAIMDAVGQADKAISTLEQMLVAYGSEAIRAELTRLRAQASPAMGEGTLR